MIFWPTLKAKQKDMNKNSLQGKFWLVFSHEHGAYWRHNSCGYTVDLKEAGRYTYEQAESCCSNFYPDGTPYEVVCPSPELIDLLFKKNA